MLESGDCDWIEISHCVARTSTLVADDGTYFGAKIAANLLGVLSDFGLALVAMGLYGTMTHWVQLNRASCDLLFRQLQTPMIL